MALAPELVARFLNEVARLRRTGGTLGLAVSGGADSMALLGLAVAAMDGADMAVATVDHGLREEARRECELVASACAERGVPCTVLTVRVPPGNMQEQARLARYAAMGAWARERGIETIATAHHADDQAETFLMRLNRGSGLAGLAGIRERTRMEGCDADIVRPLLGFRRSDLRTIVEALDLPFAEDPGNTDERYERVRIRKALREADWLDAAAIARSAAHLAETEDALASLAQSHWDRAAMADKDQVSVPRTDLPDTDARLVARAIALLGGAISHGEAIEFLKHLPGRGNIAGVLVERGDEAYFCRKEPPRRGG